MLVSPLADTHKPWMWGDCRIGGYRLVPGKGEYTRSVQLRKQEVVIGVNNLCDGAVH
jgi:hypothetical protein